MRMTDGLVVAVMLLVAQVVGAATTPSVVAALAETGDAFTYAGRPIHPSLVSAFLPWISEKGRPFTVSVDVAAAFGTNEYDDSAVHKDAEGAIVCKNDELQAVDGYRWFGRMSDGTHVLYAWRCEGDARLFPSSVLFIRFSRDTGCLPDGQSYDHLLMSVVRWYAPFDARSTVTVSGDSVTIAGVEGMAPVTVKAVPAKGQAAVQAPIDIEQAMRAIDTGFVCGGKPIHPGMLRKFIGSMADKGFPIAIAIDVAAANDSNEYFADDVQTPEKGLYRVNAKDGDGFFGYRWLGRVADGSHVVRTFLNEGGSGVFGHLCFIRFTRAVGYDPDGSPYGQLVMTVHRVYPLPADMNDAPLRIVGGQVTMTTAQGGVTIPPVQNAMAGHTDAALGGTPFVPKPATVKADLLNVRATPSLDAAIVAKLPSGAAIVVVEYPPDQAPWVRITIPNTDATGWVHSDYVVYDGGSAGSKVASAKTAFVRVSIWKGDPRREWLAEPGHPEQARFCGVHGAFPAGTAFTILAEGEKQGYPATAKATIQVDSSAGGQFDVTELAFASDVWRGKSCFLAIPGHTHEYASIEKREMTAAGEVAPIADRVHAILPDFKPLPYDYPESGFSVSDTRAAACSLTIGGGPAVLAMFTTPYADQAANPGGHCETAVLLWSGNPFVCSPDGGRPPCFFRLDGKEYAWVDFESCNNGVHTVELFECTKGKFVSIYTNDDYGS